jgi:uncharacterized protein DUF3139
MEVNMKKSVKFIFLVIIIAVFVFMLSLANSFYGNPLSKVLANHNVDKYIEEQYKELNLIKEKCNYNFKFNEYYVHVQSQDSMDTAFNIYFDSFGKVLYDSYDKIGTNTGKRLDNEIKNKIREILRVKFPQENYKINAYMTDGSWDENLPLDLPLDIKNTPYPLDISIQLFSDEKTYDNAAKIMSEAQEILQEKDIKVANYSIVIIPLKDKVENFISVSWADALTVMHIPAKLLGEENPAYAIKYYDEHQYDDREK